MKENQIIFQKETYDRGPGEVKYIMLWCPLRVYIQFVEPS